MIIYSSYYAGISKVIQVLSAPYLPITPQIIKDEAVHTSILKQYQLLHTSFAPHLLNTHPKHPEVEHTHPF
jgi:hypothetical protein